ncbi:MULTISPECIES: hypothetical protein [Cyanophyceae]|uniref:hypothetical protein n=1 Tax=Cyanophyceae TaxID=3028117 RepID=UPI001688D8BD|nr:MULTISPECIES: hypothetical protein [Cyanophyceae]MBD1917899.1 hypothetical protein [Phormidium sp. FACHB-77]MBD2029738.1 hypothetical protein [Phormidium sp. FACHB-322]MBD2052556.1 hypothetical protein [Leptolyngbya sp. FACHB-60]
MTQADPAPPTPSGGSNTAKWVALGCGGCLGVTVLAGLALAFFINRTMQFTVGPNQDAAESQELFTYTIPSESRTILDMDMFGMQMIQVANTDSPPSVLLTMGQLPSYLQGSNAQQSFVEEFQNSITTQGSYQLTEQRAEERTLCDQPVSVVIQTGSFENGGTTYNAVSLLTFVEHNNDARFVWVLAHGDASQTTADQVFATLGCR